MLFADTLMECEKTFCFRYNKWVRFHISTKANQWTLQWQREAERLCFRFKLSGMHLAFTACVRLKLCLDAAYPLRNRFNLQVKFVWSKQHGKNIFGRQCFPVDIAVWWNYLKLAQTALGINFLWNEKTASYHFPWALKWPSVLSKFCAFTNMKQAGRKISIKHFFRRRM